MFSFDAEFVVRLQEKDEQAYHDFYTETVDILYRYLVSHYFLTRPEMEDLVSDFYLKFWRVVEQYDDNFKFETFVWTVFKNMVKDYFKKKKVDYAPDHEIETRHHEDYVQDMLETKFQFDEIKEALQDLDFTSQEVLFLKFIEEKSYEEMSVFLGIKEAAVRQRLSRALKRIKEILDEKTS